MSSIKNYGWDNFFQSAFLEKETPFVPARVIEQHANLYKIISKKGEFIAEKSGKFDFFAESKNDLPFIGDWVLVDIRKEDKKAIIHEVLPRKTVFSRKIAGNTFSEQIISTNTDIIFIVSSLDKNYNIRSIERYLTLVNKTKMTPVLLINKTDLKKSLVKIKKEIDEIAPDIQKIYISAKKKKGFEKLSALLTKGNTICFVGISGVGKSSIINILLKEDLIKTNEVRKTDHKGRHTTSSKQMYLLPSGAIVIDTPGMRELGLMGEDENLDNSFSDILKLTELCKFKDCSHTVEPDCAIQEAIDSNELPVERYNSYIKLKKEMEYIKMKQEGMSNTKKKWKKTSKKMRKNRKKRYH